MLVAGPHEACSTCNLVPLFRYRIFLSQVFTNFVSSVTCWRDSAFRSMSTRHNEALSIRFVSQKWKSMDCNVAIGSLVDFPALLGESRSDDEFHLRLPSRCGGFFSLSMSSNLASVLGAVSSCLHSSFAFSLRSYYGAQFGIPVISCFSVPYVASLFLRSVLVPLFVSSLLKKRVGS